MYPLVQRHEASYTFILNRDVTGMRILHIDPDDIDNPMSGGGPIRTYEVYRRLAQRHEVTVLTPTFDGSTSEKIRDNIRYVRLGRKVRHHASSHHITFFLSLPSAVRHYPHDLLVEDFMPPASATFTPLFAPKPVIASVQWFFARMLADRYHLPFHLWEHHGLRLYKNFIVQTRAMERTIRNARANADIRLIAPGSDDSLYSIQPNYTADFALYMGRIDLAQKGVDLLLQAWARVPAHERLRLVLAGHAEPAVLVQAQALVAQLGLADCVQFVGKKTGADREALFRDARFVCVPSRDETFGMVILEACAAAKPVVLFDVAPMNEVAAPQHCELVPAFDIDIYADRVAKLSRLNHDALRERGAGCRQWAERFRWDEVARAQEQFYTDVLTRSTRRERAG